jgi:mannosyltransferase
MFLANRGDPLSRLRWIPQTTLHHVWSVISTVYLFRISDMTSFELFPTLVPGLGVVAALLALFGAWHLRADPKLPVIGFSIMTMPIAILVISIFHSFWIPRYLLWSTGPFFVLAGIGVAALPRRIFPFAAAVLLIGGLVNLAPYYRYETKPRWDLAAAYLAANVQPGDSIITNSSAAEYVLSAYGSRYHLDRPVSHASNFSIVATKIQPGNIWVVYGRVGQGSVESEGKVAKEWAALGKHVSTIKFGRHVTMLRFEHGT